MANHSAINSEIHPNQFHHLFKLSTSTCVSHWDQLYHQGSGSKLQRGTFFHYPCQCCTITVLQQVVLLHCAAYDNIQKQQMREVRIQNKKGPVSPMNCNFINAYKMKNYINVVHPFNKKKKTEVNILLHMFSNFFWVCCRTEVRLWCYTCY